jgi:6-phosphogluconolactonase (cycloisomerase 2 family)
VLTAGLARATLFAVCFVAAGCSGSGGNLAAPSFVIGGSVSGLAGAGLILQYNAGNDLSVATNGAFSFTTPVPSGGAYAVTVKSQPTGPAQTCSVASGSGTVGSANVSDVAITCATNNYALGGTVSGLNGTGLVLRNNGGNDLTINANGSFSFTAAVSSGSTYAVTVQSQPATSPRQICTVSGGGGAVGSAAITSVSVNCRNMVGRFLYVSNRLSASISAFSIDANTGALTPVAGSPFSGTGTLPASAVANPAGTLLYVTGTNLNFPITVSGTLSGFAINAGTGALTVASGGQINFLTETATVPVFSTAGDQLAISANTFPEASGHIYAYRVNGSTGGLTALSGSPIAFAGYARTPVFNAAGTMIYAPATASSSTVAGSINSYSVNNIAIAFAGQVPSNIENPSYAVLNPSGTFLFSAGQISGTLITGPNANIVEAFSVNGNTGLLTAVTGSPFASGQGPSGLVIHKSGQFLFVNNSGQFSNPAGLPSSVSAYAINGSTGVLTQVAGSPYNTGAGNLNGPVADPTGKYVTSTNSTNGTVAVFAINNTSGVLALTGGVPVTPIVGTKPGLLSFDPSGRFAYLVDSSTNSVSAYSIDSATDTLTFIASYSTGASPQTPTIVGLQ